MKNAEQHPHDGRLPCAVRTQQGKYFAGLHLEGEAVDGLQARKLFFNGVDFEKGLVHLLC